MVLELRPGERRGFNGKNVAEFDKDWEYAVDGIEKGKITLPQTKDVPDAKQVTIKNTLPAHITAGSVLAVYASFQNVTCTIDGKKVLSYNGADGLFSTDVPVTAIEFVKLNSEEQGKTITITYTSSLASRKGVLHKILIGNRSDVIYYLINERIVIMILGMVLMIVGLVAVLYKLLYGESGSVGEVLLCQGIYIALIGAFFFLQTGMNQVFFQDLNWARFLEFFAIMMLPVPAILALDAVEDHVFAVYANFTCAICCMICVIECVLGIFFKRDYIRTVNLSYISLGSAVVFAVLSVGILAFTNREKIHEMRWMLYALAALAAGGVGEILMYYINPKLEDCRTIAVGVLFHFYFTMRWIFEQIEKRDTAKERAIQKAEAKSSFLANMSHEIRTPINAILGMNQMILEEEKDPLMLQYADDMYQSGHQLLSLVNNILDYSKLESGQMRLIEHSYDLEDILMPLVKEAKKAAREKNLLWVYEKKEPLLTSLYGDSEKIMQIAGNIISNALKYTSRGSVSFFVSTEQGRREDCMLQLEVTDTGNGMEEKTPGMIFQAFHHENKMEENETLGLGLSTAAGLCRLMQGEISVQSKKEAGTSFIIRIPQKAEKAKAKVKVEDNAAQYKGWKILLVDDDPILRKLGSRVLLQEKMEPSLAVDGFDALKKTEVQKYDLILVDHFMPGMDGVTLFQEIRKQKKNQATPVAMLTADDEKDAADQYCKMGFTGYISKPLNHEKLQKLLNVIPAENREAGTHE